MTAAEEPGPRARSMAGHHHRGCGGLTEGPEGWRERVEGWRGVRGELGALSLEADRS